MTSSVFKSFIPMRRLYQDKPLLVWDYWFYFFCLAFSCATSFSSFLTFFTSAKIVSPLSFIIAEFSVDISWFFLISLVIITIAFITSFILLSVLIMASTIVFL
uniref:Uncharacterized protein n=1 Tax=Helicobacter pylori TaxID=210 RepID=Q8KXZ4_HELPX|nr:unknown [Helicobacter pylori]